jgi:hypothetical protein
MNSDYELATPLDELDREFFRPHRPPTMEAPLVEYEGDFADEAHQGKRLAIVQWHVQRRTAKKWERLHVRLALEVAPDHIANAPPFADVLEYYLEQDDIPALVEALGAPENADVVELAFRNHARKLYFAAGRAFVSDEILRDFDRRRLLSHCTARVLRGERQHVFRKADAFFPAWQAYLAGRYERPETTMRHLHAWIADRLNMEFLNSREYAGTIHGILLVQVMNRVFQLDDVRALSVLRVGTFGYVDILEIVARLAQPRVKLRDFFADPRSPHLADREWHHLTAPSNGNFRIRTRCMQWISDAVRSENIYHNLGVFGLFGCVDYAAYPILVASCAPAIALGIYDLQTQEENVQSFTRRYPLTPETLDIALSIIRLRSSVPGEGLAPTLGAELWAWAVRCCQAPLLTAWLSANIVAYIMPTPIALNNDQGKSLNMFVPDENIRVTAEALMATLRAFTFAPVGFVRQRRLRFAPCLEIVASAAEWRVILQMDHFAYRDRRWPEFILLELFALISPAPAYDESARIVIERMVSVPYFRRHARAIKIVRLLRRRESRALLQEFLYGENDALLQALVAGAPIAPDLLGQIEFRLTTAPRRDDKLYAESADMLRCAIRYVNAGVLARTANLPFLVNQLDRLCGTHLGAHATFNTPATRLLRELARELRATMDALDLADVT